METKNSTIDIKKYESSKGVLKRIFYWKFPSFKVDYHEDFKRWNNACPACHNNMLEENGPDHIETDYRHTPIDFIYNCIFCGFYSRFLRTRGFNDIQTYHSILHCFSLFDKSEILKNLEKLKRRQENIYYKDFFNNFFQSKKEYEIFLGDNLEQSEYALLLIKIKKSDISYAFKVSKILSTRNPQIEPIKCILYPEFNWDQKNVNFVFSCNIKFCFDFKTAQDIFYFLNCYNDIYPPFYEMSDELIKAILIHNTKYYNQKCSINKKAVRNIVFKGEVIYRSDTKKG
jgi:hypothetical protein